jgi:hypothetical protein
MSDFSFVPAYLAVKAMRDNGYKNAAYAISELIDNSIQHGASKVELLCAEIEVQVNVRTVSRVHQIAILDNGIGMNSDILRMALQFGNGTNLDESNQKSMGKFGMGLPSSSISQARRVEVWTWQNSVESAIYSYLDLDEIIQQKTKEVPVPIKKNIPEAWKSAGKAFGKSGTLVVWSNLDRCTWKTADAIFENSEFIIGRMYRKFIYQGKVEINMVAFNMDRPKVRTRNIKSKANDPIYLMENTSTPAPFDKTPMFDKWGDDHFEVKFDITFRGKIHQVILRFTIAKKEAREEAMAGSKPHGKHAGRNIGVSVIRADREIDLDQTWVIQYDTRERWWGVEVVFPPSLDEIFGVTNNKQYAVNFSALGKFDFDDLLSSRKTIIQMREELEEEGDPKAFLIEIAQKIKTQLNTIRGVIKLQSKNATRQSNARHTAASSSAEQIATEATRNRVEQGFVGTSDGQEETPEAQKKAEVTKSLESEGVPNAMDVVDWMFKNNLKYSFVEGEFESSAFFSVKPKGGKIIVSLNTSHPAYDKLVEVLDESTEGVSREELEQRLKNASDGLKLLLMAWARYEDEQPDGKPKTLVSEVRQDWGRIARQFLKEE